MTRERDWIEMDAEDVGVWCGGRMLKTAGVGQTAREFILYFEDGSAMKSEYLTSGEVMYSVSDGTETGG